MKPLSQQIAVPLVSYAEWLFALEKSAGNAQSPDVELMRDNPALRILNFFRSVAPGDDKEPLGAVYIDVTKGKAVAPALSLPELGADMPDRWLKAWKRAGFLDSL